MNNNKKIDLTQRQHSVYFSQADLNDLPELIREVLGIEPEDITDVKHLYSKMWEALKGNAKSLPADLKRIKELEKQVAELNELQTNQAETITGFMRNLANEKELTRALQSQIEQLNAENSKLLDSFSHTNEQLINLDTQHRRLFTPLQEFLLQKHIEHPQVKQLVGAMAKAPQNLDVQPFTDNQKRNFINFLWSYFIAVESGYARLRIIDTAEMKKQQIKLAAQQ